MKTRLNWTHTDIKLIDIRKSNRLYVIQIDHPEIKDVLFVKDIIFEERIRSYFFKDIYRVSREEILSLKWNMYITKGHYIKIKEDGEIEEVKHDANKWYISFLEIAGPLGSICSVYRDKELNKDKIVTKYE